MDCNILISLLLERKPLKLAAKLGFWLQDWINGQKSSKLGHFNFWCKDFVDKKGDDISIGSLLSFGLGPMCFFFFNTFRQQASLAFTGSLSELKKSK